MFGESRDMMKPLKNPYKPFASDKKEIHLNNHARNCLFESISVVFNQVFMLTRANEI
jgi:hypothetical protein